MQLDPKSGLGVRLTKSLQTCQERVQVCKGGLSLNPYRTPLVGHSRTLVILCDIALLSKEDEDEHLMNKWKKKVTPAAIHSHRVSLAMCYYVLVVLFSWLANWVSREGLCYKVAIGASQSQATCCSGERIL